MKIKYPVTIIGIDFVSYEGIRTTNFSLCAVENGRPVAHASIDFTDSKITREGMTAALAPRAAAIRRLAGIWRNKSTPADYSQGRKLSVAA